MRPKVDQEIVLPQVMQLKMFSGSGISYTKILISSYSNGTQMGFNTLLFCSHAYAIAT